MIDQEIIEKTIKSRGGRVNYSELNDYLINIKFRAEQSIKFTINQLPEIKTIEFDIIDNNKNNISAWSIGRNNKYFIGINNGSILELQRVFYRLLADKKILRFIGDPNKESDAFSPPLCPVRNRFSEHMTRMALDFILAHEIGHIVRGHIRYHIRFNELKIGTFENEKMKKMISKTLEMDADTWATIMLLSSEICRITGKNKLPGSEWIDFYSRPGQVLMLFSFVVSTIFKLSGNSRLDKKSFEKESYPRSRLRCFISMIAVKDNLDFIELNKKMNYDLDKFGIPISIFAAFNIIEEAFYEITGKSSKASICDAWGEKGIMQINELVDCWNTELLENLRESTYIKLFEKEKITVG